MGVVEERILRATGWPFGVIVLLLACIVLATERPPSTPCQFGVVIGGRGRVPRLVDIVKELGASCVRINCRLGDGGCDVAQFLPAGLDVVLTFDNSDVSNIDTRFGTPQQWPNAGFPFQSKEIYQSHIREVLIPLKPFLAAGRRVWAQCENEAGDATLNPRSRYWRGTTEQYLRQIQAFREAVSSVDPSIPVVLTSFPSESLSAAIDSNHRYHRYAETHLASLLASHEYDAVDLHFYGCPEDIPAKVNWIRQRLPAGKLWISTENGGPDSRCGTTPFSWRRSQPDFEQVQAKQVALRLQAAAEQGASVVLWFSLFDLRGESSDVFNRLGLIDQSRIPLRMKPAYDAFRIFVAGHPRFTP